MFNFNKRNILVLLVTLFMIFSFFSSSVLAEDLTFSFVAPKTDDPVWLMAKDGFDAAAEDFGFEGIWTGDDQHTVEGTISALDSTIATQPDGIITCPIAPVAFTSSLTRAQQFDIPVVSVILEPIKKDLRLSRIGTDFSEAGRLAIKEIHETLGKDSIKLGFLMSNVDVENQVEQHDAAKKYMNGLDGAEIVEIVATHADPNEAYTKVQNLLRANPEINAIQSAESGGTPGLGKALADMELTEKVVAIGSDDTDINLDTIRKGQIHGVTAQDFWAMGYLAGRQLYMNHHGLEVPDVTDSGIILVTNENIDTYNEARDEKHQEWRAEAEEIIEKATE